MRVLCAALLSAFSGQGMLEAVSFDTPGCHGDPRCYCRSNCTTHFCATMCNSDPTDWVRLRSSVMSHSFRGPSKTNVTTPHTLRPGPDDARTVDSWWDAFEESRRFLQHKELRESYDFIDEERPDCAVEIRDQKNGCDNCYDMAAHYMTSLTFCRRLQRPFLASASLLTQCHDGSFTQPCKQTSVGFLSSMLLLKKMSMVNVDCLPGPARPSSKNPIPECPKTCRSGSHMGEPLNPPIPALNIDYALINGGEADMRLALFIQSSISVIMVVDDGDFLNRRVPLDAEPYTCKPNHPVNFPTQYVHALCLYGWGTTRSGMPFWTFVNSWGAGWGDNGRSRIRRGQNDCYIESEQKVVLTFKDEQKVPNPTPPPSQTKKPVVPPPPPKTPDSNDDEDESKPGGKMDFFTMTAGTVTLFALATIMLLGCCVVTCCYCCRWRLGPRQIDDYASATPKSPRLMSSQSSEKSPSLKLQLGDKQLNNEQEPDRCLAKAASQCSPSSRLKCLREESPARPNRGCPPHKAETLQGIRGGHAVEGDTVRLNFPRVCGPHSLMNMPERRAGAGSPRQPEGTTRDARRVHKGDVPRSVTRSPPTEKIGPASAGRNAREETCEDESLMGGPNVMTSRENSPRSADENTSNKNCGGASPLAKPDFMMSTGGSPRSAARNISGKNNEGENRKGRVLLPKLKGNTPRLARGNSLKENYTGESSMDGSSVVADRGNSPMSAGESTPNSTRGGESPLARLRFMIGRGDSPWSAARSIPHENSGDKNKKARVLLSETGGEALRFAGGNTLDENSGGESQKARIDFMTGGTGRPRAAFRNVRSESSGGDSPKTITGSTKARHTQPSPRNIRDRSRGGQSPETFGGSPKTGGPRPSPRNIPDRNFGHESPVTFGSPHKAGGPRPPSKNIPERNREGESPETFRGPPKTRGPRDSPKNIPDKNRAGGNPVTFGNLPKGGGPRPPPKNTPERNRGRERPETFGASPKAGGPQLQPRNVSDRDRGRESPVTFGGPPKAGGQRPPPRNIRDRNRGGESPETSRGSPKPGGSPKTEGPRDLP